MQIANALKQVAPNGPEDFAFCFGRDHYKLDAWEALVDAVHKLTGGDRDDVNDELDKLVPFRAFDMAETDGREEALFGPKEEETRNEVDPDRLYEEWRDRKNEGEWRNA